MGDAAAGRTVQEAVARPAALVSVATLSSRIAGLAREALFAGLFATGAFADAFVIAFRIPNLLRDLFAEGALSSAFVPTYAKARAERGDAAAFRLARVVLGTLVVVTGAIALLGILVADSVVAVVAMGASDAGRELTARLTRIMFPFLPLVAAAAVFMGCLNAHGRVFVPALAPAAFNVVAILGGVALHLVGWSAQAAVVGWSVLVLVGGLAQAAVQVPSLRAVGFRGPPRVDLLFRDEGLRTVVRRMGPVAVALAGTQVMILVTTAIASAEDRWPSALNYAFRLIHLPIGLVGVALGVVALAAASRRAAQGDAAGLDDVVRRGLRLNLFLALPAAAGLLGMAEPIVRLVYAHGTFASGDAALVAEAVRWYALGVVFYSGVKVAATAFHARGDTRPPMTASLCGIGTNLAIALLGVHALGWGFASLPVATAAGTAVNYGILRALSRRVHGRACVPDMGFVTRVAALTALTAAASWGAATTLFAPGGPLGRGAGFFLGVPAAIAAVGVLYLLAARALRIDEATVFRRRLRPRP